MMDGDRAAPQRRHRLEPSDISELRHAVSFDQDHAGAGLLPGTPDAEREAIARDVAGAAVAPEKGPIQSVDRALDLLELLCSLPHDAKLQDIAALSGLKASTCHHLLSTLVARRFIARNSARRTYIPGPRIMELAQHMMSRVDLLAEATPYLEQLRQQLQETVYLGAMKGTDLQVLQWLDCPRPGHGIGHVDVTDAAHATALGKSILAWLPEPQIARVVADKGMHRFTETTIGSLGTLIEALRQIRRYGFAIEDQEFRDGVVAVASAVRDRNGAVIGAIGSSIPLARADHASLDRLQQTIASATVEFSRRFASLFLQVTR